MRVGIYGDLLKTDVFWCIPIEMSKEHGEKRVPERWGAIFLIYKDGKVLLEKRTSPDKVYFGYTIIPGGKVNRDNSETAHEATDREIFEECGVVVIKKKFLDRFLHVTMSNMLYETEAYLVTEYEGEIKNVEGKSEHVWVDLDKAEEMLPFADSRYIISLARKTLLGQYG